MKKLFFVFLVLAGMMSLIFLPRQPLAPKAQAADGAAATVPPFILFRHFVPREELRPAAEVGGIPALIARDLGLPLEEILATNGLKLGQPVLPGATLVVPMPAGHSWEACASYYDTGTWNADGTPFDPDGVSIASKELPKGSFATIEFLATGVVVLHVRVRDSGPYYATCTKYPGLPRAIDLSWGLVVAGFGGDVRKPGDPKTIQAVKAAHAAGVTRVKITLESVP